MQHKKRISAEKIHTVSALTTNEPQQPQVSFRDGGGSDGVHGIDVDFHGGGRQGYTAANTTHGTVFTISSGTTYINNVLPAEEHTDLERRFGTAEEGQEREQTRRARAKNMTEKTSALLRSSLNGHAG